MHKFILTAVIIVLWCGATTADELNMAVFKGVWAVHYDRTMEEGKKSPKYDEERMPAMIRGMMSKMKIKMTDSEMIYLRGTKEIKLPYTATSADADSASVVVKQGENEATITFTLIDNTYMNFKSSGSDDMDYYVWQRTAEGAE